MALRTPVGAASGRELSFRREWIAREVAAGSRSHKVSLLAVCSLLLILTACGQKGPLYRPEEAPAADSAPAGNQTPAASDSADTND